MRLWRKARTEHASPTAAWRHSSAVSRGSSIVFALRIKQVETALAAGRLEEACQLLAQPDLRAHRRGQALVTDITRRLQERIEQHLQAAQYEAALQDCHRALALAGNQPELEQLRSRAAAALAEHQQQRSQEQELLQAARQRLAQGELSLGQQLCGQLPATAARAELSAQIQRQREAAQAALLRAGGLVATGRTRSRSGAASSRATGASPARTAAAQGTDSRAPQRAGPNGTRTRAAAACRVVARAGPRRGSTPAAGRGDRRPVARSQQASLQIERGEFAAAWETLRVLDQLLPGATWIQGALDWAHRAQEAQQALRGSPLFTLRHPTTALAAGAAPTGVFRDLGPSRSAAAMAGTIPTRFLLQVDGAGRFLTLCQSSVRLGSQRELSPVDVDWSGGDPLPPLVVERTEDDYFLRSAVPVQVNGRAVQSALLADGDRLLVGSRGAIKFLLPCAASRSAVLQFSGLRLHPPDARCNSDGRRHCDCTHLASSHSGERTATGLCPLSAAGEIVSASSAGQRRTPGAAKCP